jgi:glucokinase
LVELNHQAGYIVGVGMNIAEIVVLVTDMTNKVLYKLKKKRPLEAGEKFLNHIMDAADEAIKASKVDVSKIKGIGVGIPGIVDKELCTVHWPKGLLSADLSVSVSVADLFMKRFEIPTMVDNDANAAIFGEKWLTLEPTIKHIVYLYSGVGCGIMIDGKIYRGANGCAGEFLLSADVDYVSWMKQSYETHVWGIDLGLTLEAKKIVKDNPHSLIAKLVGGDSEKVDFFTVVRAAKEKDPLILDAIERATQDMAGKISLLTNLLNPEIVIIGGGIEELGTYFLESIKKKVKSIAVEEATRRLKIIPARLGEESVALGAAALVVQHLFIEA